MTKETTTGGKYSAIMRLSSLLKSTGLNTKSKVSYNKVSLASQCCLRALVTNNIQIQQMTPSSYFKRTIQSKSSLPISSSSSLPSIGLNNENIEKKHSEAIPNFNNAKIAHGHKSTSEILRSILVFQLCKFPFLVDNASGILNYSKQILGSKITDFITRQTFYKQFCAGETQGDALPIVQRLRHSNVGIILDYAVEDDNDDQIVSSTSTSGSEESRFDQHTKMHLQCIRTIKELTSQTVVTDNIDTYDSSQSLGFAAIKVTALGKPDVMESMSTMIDEINGIFSRFDSDEDGILTRKEFSLAYPLIFDTATTPVGQKLVSSLDDEEFFVCDGNGIDSTTFVTKLVTEISQSRDKLDTRSNLSFSTREQIDFEHISKIFARVHTIAKEASNCKVKLIIDAEQTKYQSFIHTLALDLQQTYNDKGVNQIPIIFNTYQCYLKETPKTVRSDLERSIKLNYHFGSKLVRGAYMDHERLRAKEMMKASPIHESINETHACYNNLVEMLLREKLINSNLKSLEVMCATHNKESIVLAMQSISQLNKNSIHFAQLYGMSDHLTFPLGSNNLSAYKYLPYGPITEVMPYLLRRAQENSDVLSNVSHEISLLVEELKNRIFGG